MLIDAAINYAIEAERAALAAMRATGAAKLAALAKAEKLAAKAAEALAEPVDVDALIKEVFRDGGGGNASEI